MNPGDFVQTTKQWSANNGGLVLTGILVEIGVRPHFRGGTVDAYSKPCKRTHSVLLDTPFRTHHYLTFCPEDLERR